MRLFKARVAFSDKVNQRSITGSLHNIQHTSSCVAFHIFTQPDLCTCVTANECESGPLGLAPILMWQEGENLCTSSVGTETEIEEWRVGGRVDLHQLRPCTGLSAADL